MTRFAKWIERVWHGPRTRRYDERHHRPIPRTHAADDTEEAMTDEYAETDTWPTPSLPAQISTLGDAGRSEAPEAIPTNQGAREALVEQLADFSGCFRITETNPHKPQFTCYRHRVPWDEAMNRCGVLVREILPLVEAHTAAVVEAAVSVVRAERDKWLARYGQQMAVTDGWVVRAEAAEDEVAHHLAETEVERAPTADEVARLTALVARARRWIVNCVDPATVGVAKKQKMLDALAPSPAEGTGEAGCGCITSPDRLAVGGDPFGCYCDCIDVGRDGCDHDMDERSLEEAAEPDRAREALVEQLAEAMHAEWVPACQQWDPWNDLARAIAPLVAAQVEAAVSVAQAERDRLKRGGKELGRILERTLTDALNASGRHDVIDADGDGDWALVWETLAELRPRAESAEADLRALREGLAKVVERLEAEPFVGGATERAARDLRQLLPGYHTPGWPCGGQIKCPACCADDHGPTCNPDRGYCTCGADGRALLAPSPAEREGEGHVWWDADHDRKADAYTPPERAYCRQCGVGRSFAVDLCHVAVSRGIREPAPAPVSSGEAGAARLARVEAVIQGVEADDLSGIAAELVHDLRAAMTEGE